MNNYKKIQEAKSFLKSQGYCVEALWHVEDVKNNYKCTDEQAQEVLDGALNNEATTEQIRFAIDMYAEEDKLEKIEEEN